MIKIMRKMAAVQGISGLMMGILEVDGAEVLMTELRGAVDMEVLPEGTVDEKGEISVVEPLKGIAGSGGLMIGRVDVFGVKVLVSELRGSLDTEVLPAKKKPVVKKAPAKKKKAKKKSKK